MKLAGWEKVTSAEQYREMIEAEYHRLKAERSSAVAAGGGLEEIKLRLFLSLLEKPRDTQAETLSNRSGAAVVCEFPVRPAASQPGKLLHDNQPTADQIG